MKILNRPLCERCEENEAWINLSGHWICSECFVKIQEKMKKLNEKLIFEE